MVLLLLCVGVCLLCCVLWVGCRWWLVMLVLLVLWVLCAVVGVVGCCWSWRVVVGCDGCRLLCVWSLVGGCFMVCDGGRGCVCGCFVRW